MAEEGPSELVAPAPTEWGKNLRCCVSCRLVKTLDQFYEQGCENCPFLGAEGDRERIYDCTTSEFKGMAAIVDPSTSWTAKWQRSSKYVPGCYALAVQSDVPAHIMDILENHGITLRQDD